MPCVAGAGWASHTVYERNSGMVLFFSKRNVPVEPKGERPTSLAIQFAGIEAQVVAESSQVVCLTIPAATFSDRQLAALAESIQCAFLGKFEFPISCKGISNGVQMVIDDSERGQPLKSPCCAQDIARELPLITDDREQLVFVTRESALSYLNRKASVVSIASEVLPVTVASSRSSSLRQTTGMVVEAVVGSLANAKLLSVDERLRDVINEALDGMLSRVIEELAQLHDDKRSGAPVKEPTISSFQHDPVFSQPPRNLESVFAIPVLILELVFEDLSKQEILFLSDPVVGEINRALQDLYIAAGLKR